MSVPPTLSPAVGPPTSATTAGCHISTTFLTPSLPLTIYTPIPAALDGRAGSVGNLGEGGVEEKLLIHGAGRSLTEHPVPWSHCTDEENESRELAAGQGHRGRDMQVPQTPTLDTFFLLGAGL